MNNFDLYKLLNFVVNKDVYAQAMNDGEFDLELKSKNLRHFRNRLGFPEGYRTGTAIHGVESTRINQVDLTPFLKVEEIEVEDGIATADDVYYPLDFFTGTSRSADIISYQEIGQRLNDPQTKPTEKDLVAYVVGKGLRVYPETIDAITLVYYREPAEPAFAVLTNEETLALEYDAGNSVELEWDDSNKLDIMHMILADMGLNISRADVSQYATKLIETGK